MTLSELVTTIFRTPAQPAPEPADFDVYPIEYAPEVGDIVISIERDSEGTVDAIGYPYTDGVERYYVIALDLSWAAWLSLEEIF